MNCVVIFFAAVVAITYANSYEQPQTQVVVNEDSVREKRSPTFGLLAAKGIGLAGAAVIGKAALVGGVAGLGGYGGYGGHYGGYYGRPTYVEHYEPSYGYGDYGHGGYGHGGYGHGGYGHGGYGHGGYGHGGYGNGYGSGYGYGYGYGYHHGGSNYW